MKSKISEPWIQLDRIDGIIHIEPALLILALSICTFGFYKLFLTKTSPDRHRSIRGHLRNLFKHTVFFFSLYVGYSVLDVTEILGTAERHILPYIGLAVVVSGAISFLKAARLLIFEYLFLTYREAGVPVLLVNLATLVISMIIGFWLLNSIFGLELTPLVATSAVFSLIFGLALQDTLGNLFAGIAVQMDKPYEIGHWIEVQNGGQKWVGQVHEITWRATVLTGWTDEMITIPNRIIAQAQISNFSITRKPIIRTHNFLFDPQLNVEKLKTLLLDAVQEIDGIKKYPEPGVLIKEVTDANMMVRLYYYINDYGSQFSIGDQVLESILNKLGQNGISFAKPKIEVASRPMA